MKDLTTKQFKMLKDIDPVRNFLTDIYDRENENSVAVPFFEHAIPASRMDDLFLNRFWFDRYE